MKKIVAFFAFLMVPFVMAVAPFRVGPVSTYGELKAAKINNKGQLVGSCPSYANTPVQVKGMSLFWSTAKDSSTVFYSEKAVNRMVSEMNIEVIRFAMGVDGEKFDDKGRGYLSSDEGKILQLGMLRNVVNAAIENDIYVIIDWHIEGDNGSTEGAKEFFEYAAKEYGSYNNVIFEVWNEPVSTNMATIAIHADSVIKTIRKYSDNLILVGSPQWSSQPDVCASAGIQDRKNNFACTYHFWAETHPLSTYRSRVESAMAKGIPVFASEWSSADASEIKSLDFDAGKEWVDWMDTNKVSWANWSASAVNGVSAAFKNLAIDNGLTYTASGNMVKGWMNGKTGYKDCGLQNGDGGSGNAGFSTGVANGASTDLIDDLEDGDHYAYTGGFWYAKTDADEGGVDGTGKSSISNKKFLNDFDKFVYDVVLKNPDSENTSKYVAGIENIYINGGDQYNGGYKWDPYIAMGLNLTKDTTEFKDFANCKSISYKYKGAAHNFRVEIAPITNYNYHYYSAEASDTWVSMELTLDMLRQHSDWSNSQITSLADNLGRTKRLVWEVIGKSGVPVSANQPKYNYLYVDDVRCNGLSITAISGTGTSSSSGSSATSSSAIAESSSSVKSSSSSMDKNVRFVIDDLDGGAASQTSGYWLVMDDNQMGGKSSITNRKTATNYEVKFSGASDASNGSNGFAGLEGIVWNQGTYDRAPFVSIGFLPNSGISGGVDLSMCSALSYRYKGSAHVLMVQDKLEGDYVYREKRFGDVSEWTTVVVPWTDLDDDGEGNPGNLNTSSIGLMTWDVIGVKGFSVQPTLDYLYVDDVRCIYEPESTPSIPGGAITALEKQTGLQIGSADYDVFDMQGVSLGRVKAGSLTEAMETLLGQKRLSKGVYYIRNRTTGKMRSIRIAK